MKHRICAKRECLRFTPAARGVKRKRSRKYDASGTASGKLPVMLKNQSNYVSYNYEIESSFNSLTFCNFC